MPTKPRNQVISQENIYQLLQRENWTELIGIFYQNKDLIKKDSLLQNALETTISVMVKKAIELETNSDFIENLGQLTLLNAGHFIKLKPEQDEAINVAIANAKIDNLSLAYNYAKKYPDNDISQTVISKYHKEFPKEISNSSENRILTTENTLHESGIDARKSMFNSYQESEFFIALKRVFDTYQVYPNVALSNIIEHKLIKNQLNQTEQNFFFKSSIDFAVFEPFKNYYPVYFFELDSIYHDTKEQKEKDRMKDKIFSLSNSKLYRIRKRDKTVSETEFEEIIREIRKSIE